MMMMKTVFWWKTDTRSRPLEVMLATKLTRAVSEMSGPEIHDIREFRFAALSGEGVKEIQTPKNMNISLSRSPLVQRNSA